jgi:hypothetical protein
VEVEERRLRYFAITHVLSCTLSSDIHWYTNGSNRAVKEAGHRQIRGFYLQKNTGSSERRFQQSDSEYDDADEVGRGCNIKAVKKYIGAVQKIESRNSLLRKVRVE